jgi:hypothetical protein
MMKKLNILIPAFWAVLIPLTTNAADKTDIEAGVAFDMGFGVTALINKQFNIMLGNEGWAADYHLKKGTFNANVPFTWYVAGGGYHEWDDGFGVRLPLGLNLNFENDQQNWNAYTQITPEIDLNDDIKFGANLALGLRYSF